MPLSIYMNRAWFTPMVVGLLSHLQRKVHHRHCCYLVGHF
jgi:hypothetical protein